MNSCLAVMNNPFDRSVRERRAIRAFRTDIVISNEELFDILELARHAPSGSNAQPWRGYVFRGGARDRLVNAVTQAYDLRSQDVPPEGGIANAYYPEQWFEPYLERRRQNGRVLYEALGIARGEREAMRRQHRRNFEFFGAPVGMLFTMDRRLGGGSFLDYGIYLQTLMLAAKSRGWDTCPQAAWNLFDDAIRPVLRTAQYESVLCGLAIGRADTTAPENCIRITRRPVKDIVHVFDS